MTVWECKKGHLSAPNSQGTCRECARQASKKWVAANREKHSTSVKRWQTKNRTHVRALNKIWRDKNHEKITAANRVRQGLPLPSRPSPDSCECCGKKCSYKLHLDHDHISGKFRGWLCASCNVGLGYFGDGMAGLIKAMGYLCRAQ
jgi:hypothetical protein